MNLRREESKKTQQESQRDKKTKKENKILIDYKRIKINNHYIFHKQNYNLIKFFYQT